MKVFSFIAFYILTFFIANAQSEDYRRIGIIPFERFSFNSDHELDTIASCNSLVNTDEVYDAYVQAILEHISDSTQLNLFVLGEAELNKIYVNLPKEYKYKPISHFGVDISKIHNQGVLSEIATNMQVDAFLFLTKYKIDYKLLTTTKAYGDSKYLNWSVHKLDYELYSPEGTLLALADKFIIKSKNPNDRNYPCRGTVLKDLERSYSKLGNDIEAKLKKYKKKKKAVYKTKAK